MGDLRANHVTDYRGGLEDPVFGNEISLFQLPKRDQCRYQCNTIKTYQVCSILISSKVAEVSKHHQVNYHLSSETKRTFHRCPNVWRVSLAKRQMIFHYSG